MDDIPFHKLNDAPGPYLIDLAKKGHEKAREILRMRGLKLENLENKNPFVKLLSDGTIKIVPSPVVSEENDLEIGTDKLVYDRRSKTPGEDASKPIPFDKFLIKFMDVK
jgi:hypothetical protein